jgi:transposase-like protein
MAAHSSTTRAAVLAQIDGGAPVYTAARAHGVHPNTAFRWLAARRQRRRFLRWPALIAAAILVLGLAAGAAWWLGLP